MRRTDLEQESTQQLRREAYVVLVYFFVYLAYLFVSQEGEWGHWATLVFAPFGLLYLLGKRAGLPLTSVLVSVGLSRNRWRKRLGLAAIVGLSLSCLQLAISERADQIWALVISGKVAFLMPLAFVLMLVTAGFTEEFLFRGVLQTRLTALTRSRIAGVLSTSLLFGVYHLPYAYLSPSWPSHGDWSAAWASAMFQGGAGGLVLGTIFVVSGRNLVACVLTHTLINLLPAMALIKLDGIG